MKLILHQNTSPQMYSLFSLAPLVLLKNATNASHSVRGICVTLAQLKGEDIWPLIR
jgi:hypothetical protein